MLFSRNQDSKVGRTIIILGTPAKTNDKDGTAQLVSRHRIIHICAIGAVELVDALL